MAQLVHQFVKGGLLCLQGCLQLRQAFFLLRQGFFGACAQVLLLSGDQLHGLMHIREPDINQEIYGLPGYLSAIPSALLNESATLFRRKYYINGSHAGFIMYMTDAAQNQEDVNNLRNAMKSAKGPGNFRNLFMYSPNGKKDGLQIIPLSEVAAKDEFLNIKNVSRDDMMAAHRVPPQMMGIMPNNVGGFGDVEKASKVFVRNELIPLQKRLIEINTWLNEKIIAFNDYSLN